MVRPDGPPRRKAGVLIRSSVRRRRVSPAAVNEGGVVLLARQRRRRGLPDLDRRPAVRPHSPRRPHDFPIPPPLVGRRPGCGRRAVRRHRRGCAGRARTSRRQRHPAESGRGGPAARRRPSPARRRSPPPPGQDRSHRARPVLQGRGSPGRPLGRSGTRHGRAQPILRRPGARTAVPRGAVDALDDRHDRRADDRQPARDGRSGRRPRHVRRRIRPDDSGRGVRDPCDDLGRRPGRVDVSRAAAMAARLRRVAVRPGPAPGRQARHQGLRPRPLAAQHGRRDSVSRLEPRVRDPLGQHVVHQVRRHAPLRADSGRGSRRHHGTPGHADHGPVRAGRGGRHPGQRPERHDRSGGPRP